MASNWSYQEAFKRNLGLIDPEEQQRLRQARIAIAGMGGVGGIHLVTLARLGIGKFTIADPDTFEVANFNRQYGATVSSLGQSKAEVMKKAVLDINPSADVRILKEPIGEKNVGEFLKDVDLFIDGIDAFVIKARRLIYRKAAEQGIYTVTAAPAGFSSAFLIFDPKGMSCDEYFGFSDQMSDEDLFINFVVGLAPRSLQRPYMDYSYVNLEQHVAPSAGLACQLCAGIVGAFAVKILLKRGPIHAVPYYHQFDAYREMYVRGKLWGGNRHPLQRVKRWFLKRYLKSLLNRPS